MVLLGGTVSAAAGEEVESVKRLTSTTARNGQAFFSPGGERISFVSNRSGSWQVWVMWRDGSAPTRATQHEGPVGWPSWSLNGDRILYYGQMGERYRLFEVDWATGASQPLVETDHSDFRPLLSPDGERLLFDRFGATEPPNHDLFILELATGSLVRLTEDPGYDSDARWSPDGERVVFHSDREGPRAHHTQVYSVSVDGGDLRKLTSGPAKNGYPAWSPDGRWIVYTSELEGNRDLWMMRADGGGPRRLTRHPGFDGDPVWSPDGKTILFATDRFGDSVELALLPVEVSD